MQAKLCVCVYLLICMHSLSMRAYVRVGEHTCSHQVALHMHAMTSNEMRACMNASKATCLCVLMCMHMCGRVSTCVYERACVHMCSHSVALHMHATTNSIQFNLIEMKCERSCMNASKATCVYVLKYANDYKQCNLHQICMP